MKPRYTLEVPEYFSSENPDYQKVGGIIDDLLRAKFAGQQIAVRYLSMQDHPSMTREQLVETIEQTGTDKYDPTRRMSVAHDFYNEKGVDLFAVAAVADGEMNISAESLQDFCEGAVIDRGQSLKIDLIVVYDASRLETIPITYEDGIGTEAFKFKDSDRKEEAVLGFVLLDGR